MADGATREATPHQRDAARHLLAAAKHLKDAEDPVAFAEVWARDASLTIRSTSGEIGPLRGRDAIMDFYRRNWARGAHGAGAERETHVCDNPYIVASAAGRLHAVHSAIFAAMDGEIPVLIGFGEFRDELVEEDGRWRILIRESTLRRRRRTSAEHA